MSRGASHTPPAPAASTAGLWTLPNVVSLSRLGLAAAFIGTTDTMPRIVLVAVASFTDVLDGWLACRRNAVSRWGALIDPISDRAFVLAAAATLVAGDRMTLA